MRRPKPTPNSWLLVPNGGTRGESQKWGIETFLDAQQKLPKEPHFLKQVRKLTPFTNSDPKRKGTQSKRNKIVGKRVLMLKENDNCTDGAFIQTQNAQDLGFMNVPNLERKTTGWGTLRRTLEESKEVLLCFFV